MLYTHTQMSMITDPKMLTIDALNDFNLLSVVAIGRIEDFNGHFNVFDGRVLAPPTATLMRWADGDAFAIQKDYPVYLTNDEDANGLIVALLATLTIRNIVFYIPTDEFRIYGQYFLDFMLNEYGIIMNTPTTLFSFNQQFAPKLSYKFYMMDLMPANDFLSVALVPLPVEAVWKLCKDMPYPQTLTNLEQIAAYYNNIVETRQRQQHPVLLAVKVDKGEKK